MDLVELLELLSQGKIDSDNFKEQILKKDAYSGEEVAKALYLLLDNQKDNQKRMDERMSGLENQLKNMYIPERKQETKTQSPEKAAGTQDSAVLETVGAAQEMIAAVLGNPDAFKQYLAIPEQEGRKAWLKETLSKLYSSNEEYKALTEDFTWAKERLALLQKEFSVVQSGSQPECRTNAEFAAKEESQSGTGSKPSES
jgi:hypothetical protein